MTDCLSENKTILYAPKAKILVVDDNAMNLKLFAKLIKDTAIQVNEADSGMTCLNMLNEEHYDMVFMDHMMPNMDGVEACQRLRGSDSINKNITVIALTANNDSEAAELYAKNSFADYVLKPVKPDVLKQVILRYLDPALVENPSKEGSASEGTEGALLCGNSLSEVESKEDEFPSVDGVDWELAMSHFNDRDTLWDTLHNFYITLTHNAGRMNLLYSSLHTEEGALRYRINVHSMKSSARLVGIEELASAAQLLENAASRNDLTYIEEKHSVFLEKWMDYSIKLAPLFEQPKTNMDFEVKAFVGHLERLATASEVLDLDIMDPIAKALSEFEVPWEGGREKLDALLAAVVDLDTEQIAILIEQLIAGCSE